MYSYKTSVLGSIENSSGQQLTLDCQIGQRFTKQKTLLMKCAQDVTHKRPFSIAAPRKQDPPIVPISHGTYPKASQLVLYLRKQKNLYQIN